MSHSPLPDRDPHSYSRPWEVDTEHIDLGLRVDFDRKVLSGTATLKIRNKAGANTIHLDTRDLKIRRITAGPSGPELPFRFGKAETHLGQELIVDIGPQTASLTIAYETSPSAYALQWLSPAQTAGKKRPFLFTQSQAIHARSWIPLQDSPEVRVTYSADIEVPPELLALMSAENPQEKEASGRYHFRMPQAIPPYLIALAVGDLAFRPVGKRTGVYAEPSLLEAAHWELANMEHILEAAETLTGYPYAWGRYDTLILPPSFPYGGMENPRLTFATPTVITGDRSLESLHAHEAGHSWSGNLVTNKNARHFWINEGFTVYVERRIVEALYGRDAAEVQAQLGQQELAESLQQLPAEFTKLCPNLDGVDPDEAYSNVPYEKGYLFLRHIEQTVGRARFDAFLHAYLVHFSFRSIGTDDFLAFLESNLVQGSTALREKIAAQRWIFEPGLPAEAPVIDAQAFRIVDDIRGRWLETGSLDDRVRQFSTQQWQYFIRQLPADLPVARLASLDGSCKLTSSANAEIVTEWLKFALGRRYDPALARARDFLGHVGRGKFLKPLYRALVENGYRDEAAEIFRSASPGYHNIARQWILQNHPFLKSP